ncbi:gliding motility-associated C-terminal domain-containing protein [Runella sp.]|uniref:gliding motility-associated C-terminal domain-containing protein n=1 Tax=Runella sp. TaxID=1960881 RepID=UPI00261B9632|nr:gliding motility-associated C-terminal domain-containing protein [Runella sp.]
MRTNVGLLFLFLCCLTTAQAQRIYGGQIDRRIIDNQPYSYGVGCTFFADKAGYDVLPSKLRFGIYRKKDNQFIREFIADKSNDISGSDSTVSCDKSSKTEYLFVRYNYNLTLKPQDFSDADGYYIINDPVGPRNATDNVASSTIVLYHWFSPQYLWEYFDTSEPGKTTPQWVPNSFNYFCANSETNFSLQVRSVPLKTNLNRTTFNLTITNTSPLTGNTGGVSYRKVDWKAGFSENQMMPGGNFSLPPLPPNIFSGQGATNVVISAKPTRTGVYTVGFLLEHRRSGVKLSETYREYQIQVEDCLTPPPAVIRVSEVNRPTVAASPTFCEGKNVQLNAGANQPNITYEWFKEGVLITGSKDSILVVKEAASYSVVLKKKGACNTSESSPVPIKVVPNPTVTTISSVPGGLFCVGNPLQLTALPSEKEVKYQWLLDSVPLPNAPFAQYDVKQIGKYTVKVTNPNGCVGTSPPFEVKPFAQSSITMQAIPDRCSNDTASVLLTGTPMGGTFTGKGVSGNKFNPKTAGAGKHDITYTINDAKSCVNGSTKQTAEVVTAPVVNLGPDQDISSKSSVQLNKNGNLGAAYTYQWTPPLGLDLSTSASPFASPDKTTTYSLKVTDANGCSNKDDITIGISQGVHIPDVFTPNGDGLNDTWEIKGLEEFPETEVLIYDRWGHAIFESTKERKAIFDGTYNGTSLPTGSYAYVIRTNPQGHTYRGRLLILR